MAKLAELTEANGLPSIQRLIWFDLSPMRPAEWATTDVERWNQAAQVQAGYQDGVDDARSMIEAAAELKRTRSG